ncbi:MAG: radical SAM protein [Actinomycetota bacterium]|nr:radical SAM protein [Actinomycetota bacterium]
MSNYNCIFGPVASRRLGTSLGVDVIPYKTCTYDCIYCQLGRTTRKTVTRREYVPWKIVLNQLESFLSEGNHDIDYITFSGCGEPTLNSEIGRLTKEVKKLTTIPIAVLTNGSLLYQSRVQQDLIEADLVLPSLDAVTPSVFRVINRPHHSLDIKKIIEGMITFRRAYKGRMWLEILFSRGVNDDQDEVERMKEAIKDIKPDKVQLNTVIRPPSEDVAHALSVDQLKAIKSIIGSKAEIIPNFKEISHGIHQRSLEERILSLLRRRPCTIEDISTGLNIHPTIALKYLNALADLGKVDYVVHGKQVYYKSRSSIQWKGNVKEDLEG